MCTNARLIVNEEALLLAKYLRNERQFWVLARAKRVLQGDKPTRVYRTVAGKGKIEELYIGVK